MSRSKRQLPDPGEIDAFWHRVRKARPEAGLPVNYQVRWIGLDDATTEEIIELITDGDKNGTFSLPWLCERGVQPVPAVGDALILVDFGGKPRLVVQLTEIYRKKFGEITNEDTAIDGSPVRDISIWKPLHIDFWNAQLAEFDLTVTDDMPVLIEKFALRYS